VDASRISSIAIFDAATGQRERTIADQKWKATAIAWATQGKLLAVSDGEDIRVLDADSGERRWNLPWATIEGDRSQDHTVNYLGWLDRGRYLLEFRTYGALSRTDENAMIGTVAIWDVTTHSLCTYLFHETIAHGQRPPAQVLAGPRGGRQLLVFFDEVAPQVWELTGDLPGFEP
jgi:WD40 repeat protein